MNKALEAIDPKPLPTCLCRDDMASKALRKSAAHVIPTWESGGAGIYAWRFTKQKPLWTASTAIDPMPLSISPRRDDIPVEACTAPYRNDMLPGVCNNPASLVTAPLHMSFQQRNVRWRGIYVQRDVELKLLRRG